jgi:SagB-type dehydrogenase family enzyme
VQQESHSTTASDQSGTATRVPLLSRRDMAGLLLGGIGGFGLGRIGQSQQLPAGRDIGLVYHEWSKPGISTLLGTLSDWGSQPPLYKTYPDAEQIALPTPGEFSGLPTGQAIRRRRSKRDYTDKPLTLTTLSDLLYLADGINAEQWGTSLRSAPSAGALYPIEIYVIAHRVEDIEPGLYHYHVHDHALHVLKRGSLQAQVVRHGLQQQFLGEAGVVLVLTAIFQRLRFKYQERSYRYALMEVGHIGQNVYLAATSLGMGTCMVGAFSDDEVNAMLGVDGENEAALAMMPVGNI